MEERGGHEAAGDGVGWVEERGGHEAAGDGVGWVEERHAVHSEFAEDE